MIKKRGPTPSIDAPEASDPPPVFSVSFLPLIVQLRQRRDLHQYSQTSFF